MTGNKYAVIIGINNYHESLGPLRFAAADAELMRDTLTEYCGFQADNTRKTIAIYSIAGKYGSVEASEIILELEGGGKS